MSEGRSSDLVWETPVIVLTSPIWYPDYRSHVDQIGRETKCGAKSEPRPTLLTRHDKDMQPHFLGNRDQQPEHQ